MGSRRFVIAEMRSRVVCLFASFASAHAIGRAFLPPGMTAGLHGENIRDAGDWTLNIHPPEQSAIEIEKAIDSVMQMGDGRRLAADHEFADRKSRMLSEEREAIRGIVQNALGAD